MAICECLTPERYHRDPRCPWKRVEEGYVIQGAGDRSWPAYACFWCGGTLAEHVKALPTGTDDRGCDCLKAHHRDPFSPIKFDEEVWEYGLRHLPPTIGSWNVRFCPFCSAAAPESRRADLFRKPSEEECQRVLGLVEGASTVEEIVARLGAPDWEVALPRPARPPRELEEGILPLRTLHYRRLSESAVLVVSEVEPGRAQITTTGQYIGKLGKPLL